MSFIDHGSSYKRPYRTHWCLQMLVQAHFDIGSALNSSNCRENCLCWLTDWLNTNLLLVLASRVILGSESHGTHDHILLSDGSGRFQKPSAHVCLCCPCVFSFFYTSVHAYEDPWDMQNLKVGIWKARSPMSSASAHLVPWSKALLGKLVVAQLPKFISYRTEGLITVFIMVRY
jgi:hypothetical protein